MGFKEEVNKTSVCTKQQQVQKCQKLKSGGQKFIHSFFPKESLRTWPETVTEKVMNAEEPESPKDMSGRIFDRFKQGSQDI